jgi:ParB/RepB/Spo0J family partition protein
MLVQEVQVNQIAEGYHPRKNSKGLEELKEQIRRNGLCDPIRVRPEKNQFIVIDGKRRLQVVKDLGWETVPCIITEVDERNAAHQSYLLNSENCRRNLNAIEVSLHIKEMRERFGYSVQELVNLGYAKDDQTIYNKLHLLNLPEEIQEKIAEGKICPTEGYKLAGVKDPELQSRVLQTLMKVKDRSVSKTEKIIKNLIDSVNRNKDEETLSVPVPEGDIPGVFFHDSSDMREFEDGTIPLIVVSPSYGVGMEYEEGVSFEDHIEDLKRSIPEWGRKQMPGGYLCINFGDICNFGTKNGTEPEIQLMGNLFQDLLRPLNIRLRDIKIWDKGMTFVTNPQVSFDADLKHTSDRSLHNFEYIYIFKKDGKRTVPYDIDLKSRITEKEKKEWVSAIWKIEPVKNQKGHPAQFPEELPRRLIKMFSFKGDTVVDTALGSGTTIKVARELDRKGFGYERDLGYKPVIMKKLGLKEEDLKKPEEVGEGLTGEVKSEIKQNLLDNLLPAIVADANIKRERITRLTVPLKPNLMKVDIAVETVPRGDDPPPDPRIPLSEFVRPDDYEEPDQSRINRVQALKSLPSVKPDNSILLNTIVHGDAFDVIKSIEDESVDLWLTSPPYASVKSYGEDVCVVSPDEYVDWILPLMKQIHRTLKPTGSLILNINDCVVNKQRHPYVHELIFRSTKETHIKLYDTYFWIKKGTLPTGNEKRLNNWTEYLIHFCKDESAVKWNMDAFREPNDANTISRCRYPVNTFNMEVDEKGRPKQRGRRIISLNPKGKRPSNAFNFPTAAAVRDKKHPAAFHIDLPTWFIKALTDEDDLVADVFAGSGTTCLAAKMLNRKFIGTELNPEYQKCAQEKVRKVAFAKAA